MEKNKLNTAAISAAPAEKAADAQKDTKAVKADVTPAEKAAVAVEKVGVSAVEAASEVVAKSAVAAEKASDKKDDAKAVAAKDAEATDVQDDDEKAVKADAKDAEAADAKEEDDAEKVEDDGEYEEITVVEDVEVEEEVESVDEKGVKTVKTVKTIKKVKSVKKVKKIKKVEEPKEPDSIFIDHGAILPEYLPGTHLFALIRDPGTLYVYWNSEVESPNGWRLTAYDMSGRVMQSFTTSHKRGGRGYFHIATNLVSRVTLEKLEWDGQTGMTLESTIKIQEQSENRVEEKWIDVQDRHVVYEAPAQGQSPTYETARTIYQQHQNYIANPAAVVAGGGIEAMVANAPADLVPGQNPSSWFGPFRAPGSSDILVGSSDIHYGRK